VIWKRTRQSHGHRQDDDQRAIKQADLDMLELAAGVGDIDLFYLDESGFCLSSPVSYTYFFRGQQKRLEQTARRGRRLSILGLWQPMTLFIYGLAIGSFTSESYIKLIDEQARLAAEQFAQTGRIRVIVQDNGPIHTSTQVQQRRTQWQTQGLYLFFLPPYCSQMNPIESEWHQLKTHELAGQMFEDELDLAYAVMAGVEARGQAGEYSTVRFRFNSS
jgi:transposase